MELMNEAQNAQLVDIPVPFVISEADRRIPAETLDAAYVSELRKKGYGGELETALLTHSLVIKE